jgi:hypothetical protein
MNLFPVVFKVVATEREILDDKFKYKLKMHELIRFYFEN